MTLPAPLERSLDWAARLTPLWLFVLAPPLLFPSPSRAIALLGLPLLLALSKWRRGYFLRRTPLDWPILLILLMTLVSMYATYSLEFSLDKLAGLVFHIVIFYAVVETVSTRGGLGRSLALYALLTWPVLALGLLGTDWLFKTPLISGIVARLPQVIQGLPGAENGIHPNQLAGTLLWIFPLLLSLTWLYHRPPPGLTENLPRAAFFERFSRWWPWLIGLTTLAAMLLFVLTQSRGGWVGGVVAMAFFGAVLYPKVRWLVGAGIIGGGIGLSFYGWERVLNLLISDTTEALVGNLTSLGFRQEVWRAALWGLSDFPFTGMGLGTFREVARILYPLNVQPTYDIAHAHNQFLQAGLDLGLLGLVAYLSLWLGAAWMLGDSLRRLAPASDTFLYAITLGTATALLGHFVYAMSDTVALGAKPGFFLWWLFAFSVGVYRLSRSESPPSEASPND